MATAAPDVPAHESVKSSVSSTSAASSKSELLTKHGIKAYATVSRPACLNNMRNARCVEDAVVWAIILESWCGPHVREGCYVKDKRGYLALDRNGNPTPHDEGSLLKVLNWTDDKKPQIYRAIRSLKAQNRLVEEDGVWYLTVNPDIPESVTDPKPDKNPTLILGIRIPAYVYEGPEESVTDRVSKMLELKARTVTEINRIMKQARSDLKQIISGAASLFTEEIEEIRIEESSSSFEIEAATEAEEETTTTEPEEPRPTPPSETKPERPGRMPDPRSPLPLPPEPEEAVTPILDAFNRKGLDLDAPRARQLREDCRKSAPDLTTEELAILVDSVGIRKDTRLQNPVGFLLKAVQNRCDPESLARFRALKRPPPEPQIAESPPEPEFDPVVKERKCLKCFGMITEYQSGFIEWCRCGRQQCPPTKSGKAGSGGASRWRTMR